MVMPGDNTQMQVELITPIAMEKGLRFAIREGGRTVGSGTVTEISSREAAPHDAEREDPDPAEGVRLPDPRPVHRRDRGHRQADGGAGGGADPAAHDEEPLDGQPLAPRRQEEPGAVRGADAPALLDIFEPIPQTVDALMKLDLPAGVDVEIKAFGKEHAK